MYLVKFGSVADLRHIATITNETICHLLPYLYGTHALQYIGWDPEEAIKDFKVNISSLVIRGTVICEQKVSWRLFRFDSVYLILAQGRIDAHEPYYQTITDVRLSFLKLLNVGEQLIVNNVRGYLQVGCFCNVLWNLKDHLNVCMYK